MDGRGGDPKETLEVCFGGGLPVEQRVRVDESQVLALFFGETW